MGLPNWANQTIWTGDNLPILRGMNGSSVDLIYLDPPFNSKHNYAAPIGSQAAGAAFKDTWTLSDVDVEWINLIEAKHPALHRVILAAMTKSDKAYLVYMAARILELHRVLKPTGSLYLHCDPTMSHYLKLVLDAVFGRDNFRTEIIWKRSQGFKRKTARKFPQKNDVLLFYSKSIDQIIFHTLYKPHRPEYISKFRTDTTGRLYRDDVNPTKGGNRTIYLDETEGDIIDSVWSDINPINPVAKERLGYPTQKPLSLLNRIINASSNEGDMILDPFCGCATTLVSAYNRERNWTGIDISPKAAELIVSRLSKRHGFLGKITHRTDIPQRTDLGPLPKYNCEANRKTLYGEQNGDCAGCSTHFESRHLEVDHIIARQSGGTDHLSNLQLLCGNCNRIKGDRGMEYLRTKLQL